MCVRCRIGYFSIASAMLAFVIFLQQIELVRTFADQAVIAMENARLLGELQARTRDLEESLEYQTATSDVLKVIARSTTDLQPVLDTVAETAARLCGSDTGAIAIREGDVYRYVGSARAVVAEPEYWAALRQRTILPGRDSIVGRVALEGNVVHVADIRADPDLMMPEVVAAGRRTILGVPLLRDSEPIGVINLNRKRVEPFLPLRVEFVQCYGPRVMGGLAPANNCPRSRQAAHRAGGSRMQGRACRGRPHRPGLCVSREYRGGTTHPAWGSPHAQGGRARHD